MHSFRRRLAANLLTRCSGINSNNCERQPLLNKPLSKLSRKMAATPPPPLQLAGAPPPSAKRMQLSEVACPFPRMLHTPSGGSKALFEDGNHIELKGESGDKDDRQRRRKEAEDDDDDQLKSRVRKMGVFLAGAAASASVWSYGEIRKRSIMEQQASPLSDSSLKGSMAAKVPDVVASSVASLISPMTLNASTKIPPEEEKQSGKSNDGGQGSSRRQRFNFIAEVVEETAAALVFIEIKDLGVRDYFSGQPATTSNGSGFIIDDDGLILTNAHVVVNKPRASVQVKLQDGRVFQGHVEDVDVRSDLATVRIAARDLPVMRLGQSSSVRPGEFVIAMGSPLSLSNTITTGVVSSVARDKSELGLRGRDVPDYLQTDAAITFGNSGGPLINLDGEAIGINSMKVTPGISFAIPIDYAKEFLQKSRESRLKTPRRSSSPAAASRSEPPGTPTRRRYMGVSMSVINEQIIDELRSKLLIPPQVTHGVVIVKVLQDSPADKVGVQPGDIVTHINGSAVMGTRDVYKFLEGQEDLILTLVRRNQVITVRVVPEL